MSPKNVFTPYQKVVIAILAFLQFTVVLNLMILSPLGAILLKDLHITARQFGLVFSVYAFSGALSGILSAGYADRFDRKKFLLLFYVGFLIGTFLCFLATSYHFLLGARIVAGFFGGVISSISLSIVADLFPTHTRGRVMGIIQSAFSASQIMGIPIGLFLANLFTWHAAFLMIVLTGLVVAVFIWLFLKPLTTHLELGPKHPPLKLLINTATNSHYMIGFSATMLVATGGAMLQPFACVFSTNNLGICLTRLPMVYMISGLVAMLGGPYLGRLSDSIGKFKMFTIVSVIGCIWMVWYTALGTSPLWLVIVANSLFALIVSGRMSSTMAIISAMPASHERGAYMAISSSMQQLAGGLASLIAGLIIVQAPSGKIEHYNTLGLIIVGTMVVTMIQMFNVNRIIIKKSVIETQL
jgi:predicted MFS family arabinose efflux permease